MSRPETGPMQFGNDWPGVFIRGDNAAGYSLALGVALGTTEFGPLDRTLLTGLMHTLRDCDVRAKRAVQRAMLFDADAPVRFRVRYRVLGGHVHCRMFQRRPPGETWQKNGDLVFDEAAWPVLVAVLLAAAWDVLPEDDALDEMGLIPDCECRHCGHPASKHRGEQGACAVPGCECGPGGWT